jgi:hypothetical protein
MRMRARAAAVRVAAAVALAPALGLAAACARIEPPPGGPPDAAAPRLIATRPDSFAQLPAFKGDVEFRFDEVISEGGNPNQGTGTGDLEKLVILSPTTRVPDVNWRRSRITVRPKEGWRPNLVYRVELLPGATDLRRNRSRAGTVLTFTTGAPLPKTTLEATVVDWSTSRPAPEALVEAVLLPDSLPYRGVTDSSGHLKLGPLPEGDYLVRGVLDQNHNLMFDPREAFDTVRLARGKTSAGELWAFAHDTTPPRIREVTTVDSVGASVELSQPVDPAQQFTLAQVTVRVLPDSTPIKVLSLLPKPLDDSLTRRATATRDSTARDSTARDTTRRAPAARPPAARPPGRDTTARDTTARVRPPKPARERPAPVETPGRPGAVAQPAEAKLLTTRPALTNRLVVRVARPWQPNGRYEVEIRGVRTVSGVTGDVRGGLTVKPVPKPDSTAVKGDSAAARADSLRRPPPKKRS